MNMNYLIKSMVIRYNTYFYCFLSPLYYMLLLPNEVLRHIYSFDPTYHHIYKTCIDELKQKWKKEYNDYVLWRAHCC